MIRTYGQRIHGSTQLQAGILPRQRDGVAGLFVIVSITGLILWSSLKGRAQHGLAVLLVGVAICAAIYFVWVPR